MTTTGLLTGTTTALADLAYRARTVTITTPADEHGMLCEWCDERPTITNIYLHTSDGDRTGSSCCEASCVLAAAEDHDLDAPFLVEVSIVATPDITYAISDPWAETSTSRVRGVA